MGCSVIEVGLRRLIHIAVSETARCVNQEPAQWGKTNSPANCFQTIACVRALQGKRQDLRTRYRRNYPRMDFAYGSLRYRILENPSRHREQATCSIASCSQLGR